MPSSGVAFFQFLQSERREDQRQMEPVSEVARTNMSD
jgi:hypothetical protein